MIKPIQILSDVISTTAHTVNISSIVDNGDGSYTLLVDNTYYLHNLSKLTIDSNDYRVKSFILNNTLVITGTVLPTVDVFILPSPIFVHGTPKKVSGELTTKQVKEYPLIWLLEFLDADYDDDFNSSITTVLDLNLFFLTDIHFENWDIDEHYAQAIDPMANEIDFIIQILKKRLDLFGEITSHTVTNHVNFGNYIVDKGYNEQILTDQVSGCQLKISLPYVVNVCNDTVIVSKCFAATDVIKDSEGNLLYTNTIQSGAINNQTILDATNTFNGNSINGVLAEGNKDIIVQDNSPIPVQLGTVITNDKDELIIEVSASSAPPLNTSNTYKSGATVSFQSQDDGDKEFGRGFDFLTLNFNNGFSNTNRFTDDLGTQVYLSGVIIDWATWNQVTETVTAYFKTPESSTTLTNHINSQPYTKLSLGDWYVCNVKQLINIFNYGIFRNYLNYAPFNHSMSLTADRVWTSTRENVSNGIFVFTSGVSVSNQSSAYRAFICRVYTLTELGL